MRNRMLLMFGIMIVILGILLLASGWRSNSDEPHQSSVGAYVNKEKTIKANVTEDKIEIFLVADGSSALYWDGTWNPTSDRVNSSADRATLDSSLFGSQDDSKQFKVTDDGIGFEMSMMGVTRSIVLRRVS